MMITSVNAQRLTDIVAEAHFITDKMVVELGLTNVQRNNILNVNLTYLDGINSYRDIDARGWKYRNDQLRRMMTAKQWKKFKESYYFYRPIGWRNNAYVHNIYAKYPKMHPDRRPRPDFGRPDRPGRPDHPGRPDFGKPDKHHKDWKHDKDWKRGRHDFGNRW